MPETLSRVSAILSALERAGVTRVTLLVVPGLNWDREAIQQLRVWEDAGYTLAGHGWVHQASERRNWYHRLHSAVLSRDAAEHLSKSREEVLQLMEDCYTWFGKQGLAAPSLYVPPAWAMGPARSQDLDALPFRIFETLTGCYDSASQTFHRLPLMGFEADTAFRAATLTLINGLNSVIAERLQRPLRFGIHPYDLEYRLSRRIIAAFNQPRTFLDYAACFDEPSENSNSNQRKYDRKASECSD